MKQQEVTNGAIKKQTTEDILKFSRLKTGTDYLLKPGRKAEGSKSCFRNKSKCDEQRPSIRSDSYTKTTGLYNSFFLVDARKLCCPLCRNSIISSYLH